MSWFHRTSQLQKENRPNNETKRELEAKLAQQGYLRLQQEAKLYINVCY